MTNPATINRFLIALIFCCVSIFNIAQAQTVIAVNAGDGTIQAAHDAAVDGDILELVDSGGIYEVSTTDKIAITKKITIRAQDGLAEAPIIRNTNPGTSSARLFEIQAGGELVLQGLFLDGRMTDGGAAHAKNAVRSRDINVVADSIRFQLKIEDCEMRYFTEAIVKAHANTKADSVILRNCILDETPREGVLLRESSSAGGPVIGSLEMTNCTFTKIGREALYIEFSDPVVRINHCTFDSISYAENKRAIYPKDVTDVEIKNSIITNQGGTQSTAVALYGTSTISYTDTLNIAGFSLNGSASVGAGMLGVDPLYIDPANDDYTLDLASQVIGAADDGKAMGDLRWDPTINDPVVHPVEAGDGVLQAAADAAADGDILELVTSGGHYTVSSTDKTIINKKLTIRARDGLAQKPVIRNTNPGTSSARLFEIQAGGELYLKGLYLDGRMEDGGGAHAKNAVRSQDINVVADSIRFQLKIEDCDMRYFTEAIVKAHANTKADSVILRNCILDESAKEGVLLRESSSAGGPEIGSLELTNCTFTKIGREALYIEFTNPVVRINHCTFDSISYAENKRVIYPRDVTDVEIKNSIITNQGGTQSTAVALYGTSTISYTDTFSIGNFSLNGSAAVGAGMLGVDPEYNNPANDDYRLSATSPVRGAADDGRAMGDLRWEALPSSYYLTVLTTGNGLVTLDPPGGIYEPGTQVELTAVPDPGWLFDEWVGNVFPPSANPITITMNSDETITALFVSASPQVTLTVDTLGLGFVTLDPEPFNGTYDQGTMVTMTANPRPDWEFVEWLGDVTGTDNPTTVAVDSNMNVTASFASVFTQFTLDVDTVGSGGVALDPEPILGTYDSSAVVMLTAEADLGWEFLEWQGDLTGNTNPASVTMNSDVNVTAVFQEISVPNNVLEIDDSWDLRDALQFANNNTMVDTIRLMTSGGLYTSTNPSDVTVLRPIAIVAANGLAEKPIITNSDVEGSNLDIFRVFDDFYLRGVVMDGGHPESQGMKYGIRLRHYTGSDSVKNGTNITILDTDFKDFYEGKNPLADGHGLRFDKDFVAGTVHIENCTFTNFGYEAIRISETEKFDTDRALDTLIVRNSTFTNIDAECIRYYSDLDTATADAPVFVEHLTINNSATRVMFLKNSGGAVVRDIIISNSRTSGHGRDGDLMDAQGSGTVVTHVDTFNVKAVDIKATKGGTVVEEFVYGIDPRYEAPDSLNYTLLPASHLYELGSDGEAIGDLNWATNTPTHVSLAVTVVDSGSVFLDPPPVGLTYDPGTVVTLTATPVDGWMFYEWQGALTGNTNPETLTMDSDLAVTAVFKLATGIEDGGLLPKVFDISRNYPNPFNPTTTVNFQIPRLSEATLVIYNVLGQKVRTLINGSFEPGYYKAVWDGRNDLGKAVATGIYIYRFEASEYTKTQKMILMK